jgi:hypothetical protein
LLWRILWRTNPLLLAVMVGCSSTQGVVRVEALQGKAVVHVPRTAEVQQVVVEQEEFQQALKHLTREVQLTGTPRQTAEQAFQMDPLSGNDLWLLREKKLVPMGPDEPMEGALTREDLDTAERYRGWCQRVHHVYGDSQLWAAPPLLLPRG